MISIVVPVHNEEENLNELYSALTQLMESREYEIIFADDGSKDGSQRL